MGGLLELVGGERIVFFALSPALADASSIRLRRITLDVRNLHNSRLRNECNVVSIPRNAQHLHLAQHAVLDKLMRCPAIAIGDC